MECVEGAGPRQAITYDIQYVVFDAPEVDKTYAISTMVVLPPAGIDAHERVARRIRGASWRYRANGKADQPLLRLLPTPKLISPDLGTCDIGDVGPIILKWEPLKQLAGDEYYRVKIDYDYAETNTSRY